MASAPPALVPALATDRLLLDATEAQMMIGGQGIIEQQTELLTLQQRLIRNYQAQLTLIKAEAEAELARVEVHGGVTRFPQEIIKLAEQRP